MKACSTWELDSFFLKFDILTKVETIKQVLQGQIDMLKAERDRNSNENKELVETRKELKEEVKSLRRTNEDFTQQLVETNEQYRKFVKLFIESN